MNAFDGFTHKRKPNKMEDIQHQYLALLTKAIQERYPEVKLKLPQGYTEGLGLLFNDGKSDDYPRGIKRLKHYGTAMCFEHGDPADKLITDAEFLVDVVMRIIEKDIREDFPEKGVTHIEPRAHCDHQWGEYSLLTAVTLACIT